MSDELLPCPFCGGEPNPTHDDYVHDDLRPMPVVECKSCSAWVRAEDWNRRAVTAPPATDALVEALEEFSGLLQLAADALSDLYSGTRIEADIRHSLETHRASQRKEG